MLSVPLKSDISLLRFATFEMTVGRSGIHVIHVFFCGHSPDLFHALICSLLYRIGQKMGIGNIEIMFADFGGMEGRTMSFIDTFSREFIENVRKIHRPFPISSSLMVQ